MDQTLAVNLSIESGSQVRVKGIDTTNIKVASEIRVRELDSRSPKRLGTKEPDEPPDHQLNLVELFIRETLGTRSIPRTDRY
jgi:hypothetical protein